jgi:hypothetical protein
MQTKHLFLLPAFAFFACAGLQAQVVIGSVADEPAKGALLDLNSPTGNKGGLVLSNVAITDLDLIPAGNNVFPGVSPDSLDINWGLRGALVYNTHPATVPGIYVWTGDRWTPIGESTVEKDQILFTIRTGDEAYTIPTSGFLNGTNHAYDWYVTVDGQPTTACPDGRCTSTGINSNGIQLSGLSTDDHQIRITPYDDEEPGWGNAFGHNNGADGANSDANKQKLISIDAPLSTLAFAPKTSENTAAYMFAFLFWGCTNLTSPAVIRDNYKLPETITDLSYFLAATYGYAAGLTKPVDLTPLKDWFNNNHTINNLSCFFLGTHIENNSLAKPIDLTPLKDWFNSNHMITNLLGFLALTHAGNTSLKLSSDQIIFPNWVKTIKQDDATLLLNVPDAFFETFYSSTSIDGDTGEPRLENGDPLSSLGIPNERKATYAGRTVFTSDPSIDDNWKLMRIISGY